MNDEGDVIETTPTGDRLPSCVGFAVYAPDEGVSRKSVTLSSADLQRAFEKLDDLR